jgi:23S rRNA G2445 N2-methylase RlmL
MNVDDIIKGRFAMYSFLSAVLLDSPPKDFLRDLMDGKVAFPPHPVIEEGARLLAEIASKFVDVEDFESYVRQEFTAVFIGPFTVVTSPYQSTYENDSPYREVTARIKRKYVETAKLNAKVALVDNMIELGVWDARKLHEKVRDVDLIATNPPYGVRMGNPRKVLELYEDFSLSARNALKEGGKLVMITPLVQAKEIFLKSGFKVLEEREVYHGNLWVKLFIFQRV